MKKNLVNLKKLVHAYAVNAESLYNIYNVQGKIERAQHYLGEVMAYASIEILLDSDYKYWNEISKVFGVK